MQKADQGGQGKTVKEKDKEIRIEGGGRGGRTEDRQMEGMGETDGREGRQMEKSATEGGQAVWGTGGKRRLGSGKEGRRDPTLKVERIRGESGRKKGTDWGRQSHQR